MAFPLFWRLFVQPLPEISVSSPRRRGPITTGLHCCAPAGVASVSDDQGLWLWVPDLRSLCSLVRDDDIPLFCQPTKALPLRPFWQGCAAGCFRPHFADLACH